MLLFIGMVIYFIVVMLCIILYYRITDEYVGTFELTVLTLFALLTAPIWYIVLGLAVLVGISFLIATVIMHARSRLTKSE